MRNLTASELSAADNPLAASPLGGPAPPAASASGGTTIGGPVDPVELFLGHAVSPTRTTAADVPATEEGVRTLADAGAWKAAGALAKQLLDRSHPVDVLLRLRWYRIVALLKLRDVAEATREMAVLGDLNGGSYRYERYETVYPGRSGSMVPFSLRLLHAHMPALGGDAPPSLQRLYTLLGETDAELGALAISAPAAHRAELVHRRRQLCLALVNVYVSQKEHALAVAQARNSRRNSRRNSPRNPLTAHPPPPLQLAQLLEATQKERKQKAEAGEAPATVHAVQASESKLLSMLGRLQLQVGNVAAAEDAYAQLECLIADADEHPDVRLNRGFLAVALGDYEAALPEFEAVLALVSTVCTLYAE